MIGGFFARINLMKIYWILWDAFLTQVLSLLSVIKKSNRNHVNKHFDVLTIRHDLKHAYIMIANEQYSFKKGHHNSSLLKS